MTPKRDLKQILALGGATLFIGLGLVGKTHATDISATSINNAKLFEIFPDNKWSVFISNIHSGAGGSAWYNGESTATNVSCPNPTLADCNGGGYYAPTYPK